MHAQQENTGENFVYKCLNIKARQCRLFKSQSSTKEEAPR